MFSDKEEMILKVIGKKKMTIRWISEELHLGGGASIPMDHEITISNALRRVIKKCEHHKLKWTLEKYRTGGKLFWYRKNL